MIARPKQGRWLQIGLMAVLAALVMLSPTAHAHEVRPAYLQIDEIAPGRYQLLWRTPVLAGMRLPVVLRLPEDVRDVVAPPRRNFPIPSSNDVCSMPARAAWRATASSS